MTDRVFVDTNVWVYAVDADEPVKQGRAREVLAAVPERLVTSAQVLGEFFVTVTRRLGRKAGQDTADRMLDRMAQLPVVAIDAERVQGAITGCRTWQLSYWDALIIETARAAGCSRVLTEDLQHGATYAGVRVENPFLAQRSMSESTIAYGVRAVWGDDDLTVALARYEDDCKRAGMRPNAVHSYWDYARRFLAWRTGDYRPRGTTETDRPVADEPVTADDLEGQAAIYAQAIQAAGRGESTVDTYHRHAMFFVRWLRGDFEPGARLHRR